jgi:hypothetical protein
MAPEAFPSSFLNKNRERKCCKKATKKKPPTIYFLVEFSGDFLPVSSDGAGATIQAVHLVLLHVRRCHHIVLHDATGKTNGDQLTSQT